MSVPRAWELGEVLDWALTRAAGAGFASVTVACEPTGHRWRVLDHFAAARGLALVCVQPLLVYRARESEDLTRDKSDPKDAVLIARLASELRCYEPERADAVWARLRHLGARRSQLTTGATAAVKQIRDLLDCAWPAVLAASGSPFRSVSWCASLAVVLDRCAGDLARVRRLGLGRFTAAVRRELPRWGGIRPCLRIIRAVFAALSDPAGVTAHRPGALERAHLALGDWRDIRAPARRYRDPDVRGHGGARARGPDHDDRGADRHRGRGDLGRHRQPGPVPPPAGAGQARRAVPRARTPPAPPRARPPSPGAGRPGLRLAAWRAVWAAMPNNPVMPARFAYLDHRQDNRLARQQARTACAAALLRWIHVVVTRHVTWDPAIAAGASPARRGQALSTNS